MGFPVGLERLDIGSLYENIQDAVVVVEAGSGQIVMWNPAAEDIFGYPASEALGLDIGALVPEHAREQHRARMARRLDTNRDPYTGTGALVDLPALRKGGEEIRVEYSLTPIDLAEGTAASGRFLLAIVRDVTGRVLVEDKLGEQEKRFRALIQNARDIIIVTDENGTIRYVSPSVERVLGHRPEVMVGANKADYIHPEDLEGVLGELDAAVSRPGAYPVEARVRHGDGSWRWLEGIANNLLHDPAVRGVVFNHRDVTERKLVERELERRDEDLATCNEELERLAYSVAHDLRAPLRSISGFSELLLEDHAGGLDEEGKDYLGRVRDASRRMGQMMDGLLDLSRIIRARMHHEAVDLSALARDIAEELEKAHPGRQVEFVLEEGLMAEGDRRLLRVALENLLGNAWKFTGGREQATIEFGATDHGGVPAYYVRDDGAGFDMTYAGKLFGPFQRLHPTDEFDGLGTGLATVALIVRRHGGKAWAEGKVEGGATFYFTL